MVAATIFACTKEKENVLKHLDSTGVIPQSDGLDDCEENENTNDHPLIFGYIQDGEINEFAQWWNSDFFEWRIREKAERGDAYIIVGDVTFNLFDLPTITIDAKGRDGFSFRMDDETPYEVYTFSNVTRIQDTITFLCTTSSGTRFSLFSVSNDNGQSIDDFIHTGDVLSVLNNNGTPIWYNENTQCYLPLIPPHVFWGAACLIAGLVNMYCNRVITNGVNNCAEQGLPAQIGPGGCSVKCIEK